MSKRNPPARGGESPDSGGAFCVRRTTVTSGELDYVIRRRGDGRAVSLFIGRARKE